MTINELIEKLNTMKQAHGDMTLRVQAMGGLAGYPVIDNACNGFDWNKNSIVLIPHLPLTIDRKALDKIKAAEAAKEK